MISLKLGELNMTKIVIAFLTTLLLLGCSSKATDTNAEQKLVIEKSLAGLTLNDQHGKSYTLTPSTSKIIYAFSKDVGHTCNNFFATKNITYLDDVNAVFVADVSGAPSLIRSMFILPGLKDFKHKVLVLDDKKIASKYSANQDTNKIIVVELKDGTITAVKSLSSVNELEQELKN